MNINSPSAISSVLCGESGNLTVDSLCFASEQLHSLSATLAKVTQNLRRLRWLQDVFCDMAEKHPEFELGEWDEFVCDEEGRPAPYELLFQIRLRLANLYRVSGCETQEVK
jgi:hypothetical protein